MESIQMNSNEGNTNEGWATTKTNTNKENINTNEGWATSKTNTSTNKYDSK